MERVLESRGITQGQRTLADIFKAAKIELEKFKTATGLDTTTKEGRVEWKRWLGINIPLVPSADDYTREASCLRCRDFGWLLKKVSENRSEAVPCPECSHWEEQRKQYIFEQSGIPQAKKCCNFESFMPAQGADEAANAAYELAKGESTFKLLLIYGGVGNGKTHLAYAAGLEARNRGKRVKFCHVGELLSSLRRAMDIQGQSADLIVDELKSVDFLILDDLGTEKGTDWQQSIIEEIINYRYSHELPLIVTSNKDQTRLPEPILSRFKDAEISKRVLNTATDYRAKKGKK